MNNNGYNFINADEIAKQFDPDNKTGGEIKAGREFFKRIDTEIEASKSFILSIHIIRQLYNFTN